MSPFAQPIRDESATSLTANLSPDALKQRDNERHRERYESDEVERYRIKKRVSSHLNEIRQDPEKSAALSVQKAKSRAKRIEINPNIENESYDVHAQSVCARAQTKYQTDPAHRKKVLAAVAARTATAKEKKRKREEDISNGIEVEPGEFISD